MHRFFLDCTKQDELMSEETNAEHIMRFRNVSMDETKEWERREWELAKERIDLYFVPSLMEYEKHKNLYIPNILQCHTPNVMDGGIMLSVAVYDDDVYSNDDGGWIAQPSNKMEFVLGKYSFLCTNPVYSRASIDRNSDKLYHIHIDPVEKVVSVDIVSNPEDEQMRQWLLKNDMQGVVYQRKLHPDTLGPQVLLKRFQKKDYIVDIEDPSLIDEPMQVDKIKAWFGLTGEHK